MSEGQAIHGQLSVVDTTRHRGEFFTLLQVNGAEHRAGPGALVMIPAGARHHVRNPGRVPLFFVTMYAPPEY